MQQNILRFTFLLAIVLLSSAGVRADWNISVATMENGIIVADCKIAPVGKTVTLKAIPLNLYQLNAQSLKVEKVTSSGNSDTPSLSRKAPVIGDYVSVTQTGNNTFTFIMPASDVLIMAEFFPQQPFEIDIDANSSDGASIPVDVSMTIKPDYRTMTYAVNKIVLKDTNTPTEINLPATVTDHFNNVLHLAAVETNAFFGQTNITHINLPDTEEMLRLEDDCFTLDNEAGDSHHIAIIRTPLSLLDDYALSTVLSEHYQASKVKGRATAKHLYWTLSCGVDVELPADVVPYIVISDDKDGIDFYPLESTIIKANNGVLLQCPDNEGHTYDVTALPSDNRPAGSAITTENAKSYPGNLLEPVIEKRHFLASRNYYVLVNNKFCAIQFEEDDVMCPASKAVLRLPMSNPHVSVTK